MSFLELNFISVIIAAIAGFAIGGVWYSVLGNAWMSAVDMSAKPDKMPVGPMLAAIIANFIMAAILSGIVTHVVNGGEWTIRSGIISGILVWVGFVITTQSVNYAFQGKKISLTIIDGGHWLLVLVVQGAILGYMGV
ncbi:MAG: DUF1761 domain-containing protein [Cohaesibacteraceae bacterium]|nr:DUF1761 domain-containing protein [Cohaesibacteraceae bacterium]MBL4876239.1 DUF1761 domain-containing protein [Cohaesibacteraceae bacterium]